MKRKIKIERGKYGEITKMPDSIMKKANALLKKVQEAEKVDEHGNWDFGILDRDYKKGRVHSINYDFYAVGYDIHNDGFLVILQVREFYRRKSSYYPQLRKNYFLMGTNEDGRCFSHPIESRVIHSAIKRKKDVIKAVQDWIFGCDYSKVIRQGDICLKPVRVIQGELREQAEVLLEDSHLLTAEEIYMAKENYYCLNPSMVHTKSVHPEISGKGLFKVIIANRTDYWRFAAPTLD